MVYRYIVDLNFRTSRIDTGDTRIINCIVRERAWDVEKDDLWARTPVGIYILHFHYARASA